MTSFSDRLSVLERERVESVYEEWHLGQSGAVTPDKAVEIGRLLGAEYLITGEFTNFNITTRNLSTAGVRIPGVPNVRGSESRAESAMNVRVVSVGTGEIVAASQAQGNEVLARAAAGRGLPTYSSSTRWDPTIADRALGPAIEKIVADLVSQRDRFGGGAPAAASRAPVITGLGDNSSVYIDQGENAGMTVGTRFHVHRVVDVIKDRDGNVLDQVTERVGTIEVVRVLSQSSVCTIREGRADVDDQLTPASGT
ncbi:curli production assembly/transport component CsgG [soil metagenome]|nr:hypothetical protein [Gemmatimonadota bacterium]